MNPEQAAKIALDARERFELGPAYRVAGSERRIIELVEGHTAVDKLPEAGPTKDIEAWVVTLSASPRVAEFAIDGNGQIVRVRRSR